MRKILICGMFVLAGVVAMPAFASELSVTQDNRHGSLSWHDGKDALVLRSGDSKGIHVIAAEPAGIFGLRASDDILAVDNQPVDSISGLLDKLRASHSATAKMLLLRDGSRQVVTVKVQDYMRFMPPKPPTPPPPPAAPLPPPPPAPPAPPASGW